LQRATLVGSGDPTYLTEQELDDVKPPFSA
jgi:hypothetical protein